MKKQGSCQKWSHRLSGELSHDPERRVLAAKIFSMEKEKAIIPLGMNTLGNSIGKRLVVLTAFGAAMGFLEAVVVVYLRQLYYPDGFSFPLMPMALEAFSLESLRELSTIIMLVCLGMVAGRNSSERLAWGLYCFGIWDIFYYVWLKALLDWPSSWMTWDILFLIPIVWSGPVLAPIICSLTMIMIAAIILIYQKKGYMVTMKPAELIFLSLGAVIIVCAFVWEYAKIVVEGGFLMLVPTLDGDPGFRKAVASHIPVTFSWLLFFLGEGLIVISVILFWKRMRNLTPALFDKVPQQQI